LARYLYELGYAYRAIHENLAAIRIKENYGPPIIALGLIYLNQNDLDNAEYFFRKAVHWHPGADFNARFNLALTLEKKGRTEEAMNEYREAIKIKPGHVLAMQKLGNLLMSTGRVQEGIKFLEQAVNVSPNDGIILCNLGFAYLSVNRRVDAENTFIKASADRNSPEALYGIAQIRISQNRIEEARLLLEKFISESNLKKRPELSPFVEQAKKYLAH